MQLSCYWRKERRVVFWTFRARLSDLKAKHPEGVEADESVLLTGDVPFVDPVMFENLNENTIAKAALKTRGAAGPSGQDADGWRRILVSKNLESKA